MNLVSSHHVLSGGTWERRGKRETGRSWVHQFSCKIISSILVRGGKQYVKTRSWGAGFPYWKHLALAVSLSRILSIVFSTGRDWKWAPRDQCAERNHFSVVSNFFVSKRPQEGNRQGSILSQGSILLSAQADPINTLQETSMWMKKQHLRFLPNETLVIYTKASSHIRLCKSYFPIQQLSSLGQIWFSAFHREV